MGGSKDDLITLDMGVKFTIYGAEKNGPTMLYTKSTPYRVGVARRAHRMSRSLGFPPPDVTRDVFSGLPSTSIQNFVPSSS